MKWPRADLGHRPVGDENPGHGWAWKCSIPGAAEGPLAGKTVGVKDNVCVAGLPMLNGSPIMEGYVAREDATVVTRLLDAGAHIVGKAAVPAFCFDGGGLTGYPDPQPVNPHNPAYLAGSSSNGSAVVVVNEQCDMALGGDQGGSIRLPASWSGCCGHKPTHGLVPYTGIFPIELTLDHIGPMARTVADCALMLGAIAGEDGLDPRQIGVSVQDYGAALEVGADGLRVGVLSEGFGIDDVSEPDVDAAVRAAADVLARAGASVEEVSVPMHRDGLAIWNAIAMEGATDLMVRGDAFGTNHKGHYTTDLVDFYGRARRARAMDYSVTVKFTMLIGAYLSEDYNHHYYAKAQNLGRRLKASYAAALERVDVLLLPTTAMKARAIPRGRHDPRRPRRRARQPPQHVAVRRHRQPGPLGPVRDERRPPGRPDARRPPLRRRDRPARRSRLRGQRLRAVQTRNGVIGSSLRRAPVAAVMALAIAAGTPHTGGSPMPLAPNGPSGAGTSTIRVSIGGT